MKNIKNLLKLALFLIILFVILFVKIWFSIKIILFIISLFILLSYVKEIDNLKNKINFFKESFNIFEKDEIKEKIDENIYKKINSNEYEDGFIDDLFYKKKSIEDETFFQIEKYSDIKKINITSRQICFGYVKIDNFSDISQKLENSEEIEVINILNKNLFNFFNRFNISETKLNESLYLIILNKKSLDEIIKSNFSILKEVTENIDKNIIERNINITLSIGIALDNKLNFKEYLEKANEALIVSESRGGSQATVYYEDQTKYFGGKVNINTRLSKTRLRSFSSSLKKEIDKADNVFIMGHEKIDLDCFASLVSLHELIEFWNKKTFLIANENELKSNVKNAYNHLLKSNKKIKQSFVFNKIGENIKKNSLLIIVDTNSQDLLQNKIILNSFEKIIVIDHHIIDNNTINEKLINYIDQKSSSSSEIITGISQYIKGFRFSKEVASILMSGILQDTNNFFYRTTQRTFEIAGYLKSIGSSDYDVNKIIEQDKKEFKKINKISSKFEVFLEKYAIVVEKNEELNKIEIAKIADKLISISEIEASFVLSKNNNSIIISARSKESIFVHKIIERLGGGGHSNMAAAEIKNLSIEEVEKKLKSEIKKYNKEV